MFASVSRSGLKTELKSLQDTLSSGTALEQALTQELTKAWRGYVSLKTKYASPALCATLTALCTSSSA